MKFLPVVNMFDATIHTAILNGQLKLQIGQWISCGGKPYSRFIGTNGRTIDAVHGVNGKEVTARFMERLQVRKDTIKRFGKL